MHSRFGPVSDEFAMDNVECIGDEDYIWRCPHETVDNCGSHEGAGVICSMYGQWQFLILNYQPPDDHTSNHHGQRIS